MVEKSANTILRPTNLLKRNALRHHDAQFLALVIGASSSHAPRSFRFQEATIVEEAQKPGLTSSPRRHNLEVKNAATKLETKTQWIVATVHAKSLALVSSMNGASAPPLVVVEPRREPSKSLKRQNMVARIAPISMGTRRMRTVEWTHAPLIVKDHGVNGMNAVKHALIARVTVPLARSRARTLSL